MDGLWNELVSALTNGSPGQLPLALLGLAATAGLIWVMKGRTWAYVYVALIPALNWSFGKSAAIEINLTQALGPYLGTATPILFNPLTIATGMVFVMRDFVQREMGHKVLILMALGDRVVVLLFVAGHRACLGHGVCDFGKRRLADLHLH